LSDLQTYCPKCKTKVPIRDPEPVTDKRGRAAVAGTCPKCGGRLFRFVKQAQPSGPARKTRKSSVSRSGKLVIVESPAKARTIQRYLGKDYVVKASIGHVRDLLRSRLSVDVDNGFAPTYRVPNEKRDIVKQLTKHVSQAKEVYLATDPDREGEAIAWHLMAATHLDHDRARRVVFHEVTPQAVKQAFEQPRGIDMNLVNAQQARRILDRLVGYKLSPLLWQKVRSRLSAGRVQSVAVRLIVEREREIQQFVPEEYWTVNALLAKPSDSSSRFRAELHRIDGKKASLKDAESTHQVCESLRRCSFSVASVKRGTRRRSSPPPFITSTLQQEASRALGFRPTRTMRVAQQLYEGVELAGEGLVGLITYMRTDSVNVSEQALKQVRQLIASRFGHSYLPDKPNRYRTRSKSAQEAHEAIRPTSAQRTPEDIAPFLTRDQFALYKLIWRRFVASQMRPAIYDTISVNVRGQSRDPAQEFILRAAGSTLQFPGFLVVYQRDGQSQDEESKDSMPPLEEGEPLTLIELNPEQHFTQPPPRYTEAALIRELERKGIGRPSTYATIISTIIARGYVERKQRVLVPTDIAFLVTDQLTKHFPDVMDVGFTAKMEDDLDAIAAGQKQWVPIVEAFYGPFQEHLERAQKEMKDTRVADQPAGFDCEVCGAPMVIKYGRYGKFIGCSNYPECKNTKPFLEKIGVKCPKCGGEIVRRKSRRGRVFYGCERYPDCDFRSFDEPLPTPCPACGGMLVRKGRSRAQCTECNTTFPLKDVMEEHEKTADPEMV